MSRVLFCVPPLTGHVNPTLGLGQELSDRGHEVAWAGLPGVVDALLPPGATFLPLLGLHTGAGTGEDAAARRRGPEALRFLWEGFILPYARATAEELSDAARRFGPDVMVVDQQTIAGAIVAGELGVPWVTSASTSGELTGPLDGLPKVKAWVERQMVEVQIDLGVPEHAALARDLRFSDRLTIAFTTETLSGPVARKDLPIRFVGPSITKRFDPTPFPWEWLDADRRHVLVSLGTVNAAIGGPFFSVAHDALSPLPLQTVLVAPDDVAGALPCSENVLVVPRVPQLEVLERMDAVVCHGGHNTVCESLALGLPLVVAPVRDDQTIVAEQVVAAGAGVRVRFARVRPPELREAVLRALDDRTLAAGADAVRRSFADAGGTAAAADAVEQVLLERERV